MIPSSKGNSCHQHHSSQLPEYYIFFIVKTYLPCFDIFMPKQRLARDVARTIYLVRSKCKLFYKYV
jgi:hypothetical protein